MLHLAEKSNTTLFPTFIFLLFSVQYAVHLYEYLKEWHKNPHWSFSCCLAFLLPLIDFSGEISGLVETNAINNQLKTEETESVTILGVLKDSGAIDVTIECDGQKVQEENCNETPLQYGKIQISSVLRAWEDRGYTGITFEDGEKGEEKSVGVQRGISHDVACDGKRVN